MNELFERIENDIISYADDNDYKETYAYFKIGDIESIIDNYRYLQFKIDKANKILDKYAKTDVEDYNNIIKFYKELRNALKEDK